MDIVEWRWLPFPLASLPTYYSVTWLTSCAGEVEIISLDAYDAHDALNDIGDWQSPEMTLDGSLLGFRTVIGTWHKSCVYRCTRSWHGNIFMGLHTSAMCHLQMYMQFVLQIGLNAGNCINWHLCSTEQLCHTRVDNIESFSIVLVCSML